MRLYDKLLTFTNAVRMAGVHTTWLAPDVTGSICLSQQVFRYFVLFSEGRETKTFNLVAIMQEVLRGRQGFW